MRYLHGGSDRKARTRLRYRRETWNDCRDQHASGEERTGRGVRRDPEAPIEHAEAILSLYEFVQALHDRGILDMLRGIAGSSDDITERISSGLNSPSVVRAIRNMILLGQIMGSFDPALFGSLHDAAIEVAARAWTILKRADSENGLRALAAATDFLESFGRHLKPVVERNGP